LRAISPRQAFSCGSLLKKLAIPGLWNYIACFTAGWSEPARPNKQCGIHIMLRNTGIKEQQWQK
jgi:hypothetical protein